MPVCERPVSLLNRDQRNFVDIFHARQTCRYHLSEYPFQIKICDVTTTNLLQCTILGHPNIRRDSQEYYKIRQLEKWGPVAQRLESAGALGQSQRIPARQLKHCGRKRGCTRKRRQLHGTYRHQFQPEMRSLKKASLLPLLCYQFGSIWYAQVVVVALKHSAVEFHTNR